jgi:hypothetical protein
VARGARLIEIVCAERAIIPQSPVKYPVISFPGYFMHKSFLAILIFALLCVNPAQAGTADWMQEIAPFISNKSLLQIAIPGTHNSATYHLEHEFGPMQGIVSQLNLLNMVGVGFIITSIARLWSKCQENTIREQLEDGYRFLDLRVTYRESEKQFYTVHGLYGPSLKHVLEQIASFLADHPQEIVIVQVGDLAYMPGEGRHTQLIDELRAAFRDRLVTKNLGIDVPIQALWAARKNVILIYDDKTEAAKHDDVFSRYSALDSYWPDERLTTGLKAKLDENLSRKDTNRLHVAQAVLTPNIETIKEGLTIGAGYNRSLRDLAQTVKNEFPSWLESWKHQEPNIIIVDFGDRATAESIFGLSR